MTKSKKLISMLLALVMLLTSCSLSFFAYAGDVEDANSLAKTAMAGMTANQVKAADTDLMNKIKAMSASDREAMNPVYYAYALYVATTQILLNQGTASNKIATERPKRLVSLYDESATDHGTVSAAYEALIGTVPSKYVEVIEDLNALNTEYQIKDDTYLTATTKQYLFTLTNVLTNLNFPTNATASGYFSTFWSKFKDYDEAQILFMDFVPVTSNGVTDAFTKNIAGNAVLTSTISTNPETSLNYYFADDSGYRIADLYFFYTAKPLNANVVKAKYISGSSWVSDEAPAQYYQELKTFYADANNKVKTFYVDYLSAFADASDEYAGLDGIGDVIDVGLKLQAGESVPFSQIKAAYKKYDGLKDAGKTLIATINAKSNYALFNAQIKDLSMRGAVKFGENDAETSIDNLRTSAGTMSNATAYVGDKIMVIIQAVIDAYNENKALDEFEELVNDTVAKDVISADDVTAVWNKFKDDLSAEQRLTAKNSGELWTNVNKIMTSQFVQYVNNVNMNNVTDTNRTQSTALLNSTVVETVDETQYDFKNVITTSNDYKTVYNKYKQIQIDKFRKYVEAVDLDNVTEENRTQAKALYDALADEFKTVVQNDSTLYKKYLAILASEFKDYIASIDLNTVDDAVRQEAMEKYQALSDDAKETAYNDAETWDKYCAIQTPDTDKDKHEAEAAKKADKVTYPTSDSEAIKALGTEKSIDNVEDFIIDDLLPTLTDQIVITDKKDVVNSALKQHLSGATVGKIYSLYATLSHNKKEVELAPDVKMPAGDIAQMLISASTLGSVLYEDSFAGAKQKIQQVVASGQVPTDEKGNPVQVPCGENEDGTTNYEDANIYDAIAAIEFTDEDFGITDNNRAQFEAALLAALRPITALCSPYNIYNQFGLNVDFFNHVDKATGAYTFGVYECAVKIIEALGVTGLPSDAEYKANYEQVYNSLYTQYGSARAEAIAGDELLKPVIDGVFRLIDSELKTLTDILALFPRLGDLVQSDVPHVAYTSLVRSLGALAPLLTDVTVEGQPLDVITRKEVLAPALLQVINNKLGSLGIKLKMPNWNVLNKYTTFKVNKSAQLDKDYIAVRYIGGDEMFTEAVYYLYDNLFGNKDNATALKDKIGGFPLVGENIKALIEKAEKDGKMKTYAAILDYFYDNGENPDATADAGKSIGDAIKSLNNTLNFSQIDASRATVKLTKRKFAYNGKIQKPSVKVTLDGEVLKKGIAYEVKYSKNKSKKIGTYKVTVKFIGAYKGANKTLKYTIGPKNARKIKLTSKSGAFKIKYKKSKSKAAKGYVIEYSKSKNFKDSDKVKVQGRSTTSKTISGLDSGKYYVRIKSYAVKGGKKIYSPYSNKKAVKVK